MFVVVCMLTLAEDPGSVAFFTTTTVVMGLLEVIFKFPVKGLQSSVYLSPVTFCFYRHTELINKVYVNKWMWTYSFSTLF